jgi:nitrite reductase (NADH) large subunit
MKSFRCSVCGYIHFGEMPPDVCPVCGVSASEFELFEEKNSNNNTENNSWRCINCEYIHENNELPEKCPICGVGKDMFEPYIKDVVSGENQESGSIVIVGSGVAGVSCAEEIRKNNTKAKITIISEDSEMPYYRLNLTRYLAGEVNKNDLNMHSLDWFKEKEIALVLHKKVVEINKEEKFVVLDDKTNINFDKLVLANGSHPFIPPFKGNNLKNVISVKTVQDADYILQRIKNVKSCVCIGAGILGLEVAGAISKQGVEVTLLEGAEWLMPRQLNKKAGILLKSFLDKIGIKVKENSNIDEIFGEEECKGVKLSTGEMIDADLVIITAGVRPNKHLAIKANLEVNNGVVVDNHMKTSNNSIYAIGDVSEHHGIVYGLWNTAQYQGIIAAQNLNGMSTQFGGIPRSNVLKVLGLDLFSIGEFIPKDASYKVYEEEKQDKYTLIVLRDGKIVGSIIMGQ